MFRCKGRRLFWEDQEIEGDPFSFLKEIYRRNSLPSSSPLPFMGGLVGYFSYDLGFLIEEIPPFARDDLNLPDCMVGLYDKGIVWDHLSQEAWLVYEREEDKEFLWEKLKTSTPAFSPHSKVEGWEGNFSRENYIQAIIRAKEYIRAGDIYQVNLSQRFSFRVSLSPLLYFFLLTRLNPSFFSAYLNFPPVQVVSSSPERFLYLEGERIQTRPIKGTRPRGRNSWEDERLRKELEESEKDKAELVMIVDLERNDLGKICKKGTVRVPNLREIETHPTVFHTVSTIEGEVREDLTPLDCLYACFPGGSITGAPKVRAMQIIEELEPTRRSLYTGSIGYISLHGRMDLNIVIRTVIFHRGYAHFQVGGGIVADSDPEREYQETLDKGKALVDTFQRISYERDMVEREIHSLSHIPAFS